MSVVAALLDTIFKKNVNSNWCKVPNNRNISNRHIATLSTACCTRIWPPSCDVLQPVVSSSLKMAKFFMQHYRCCMMLYLFGQVYATKLHQSMRTCLICKTQHATMCYNRVAKRTQHVVPNNVAIHSVNMLQLFGQDLQILGQQCCSMLHWNVPIIQLGLKKWELWVNSDTSIFK